MEVIKNNLAKDLPIYQGIVPLDSTCIRKLHFQVQHDIQLGSAYCFLYFSILNDSNPNSGMIFFIEKLVSPRESTFIFFRK